MLSVSSDIEGKSAYYGHLRKPFALEGFHLCGNWEYYEAFFDAELHQHEGVTIYLRLPVQAVQGKLDQDDALLEFGKPFLIKHIVHTGIVSDFYSVFDMTGLNQFQAPLDPDDRIEHETKWRRIAEQWIDKVKVHLY